MKMRIATLSLTILCLALSVPVFAGTVIYNDGPSDGNTNAFFIDGPGGPFQQTIADGFFASASGTPTSIDFTEWTLGGAPTTVTWALSGVHEFDSDLGSGTASGAGLSSTFLFANGFGYSVYNTHIVSLPGAGAMTAGNQYFLTLGGANDSQGTQFDAWDLNNGPATCFFAVGGSEIGGCGAGGESFTITAGGGTGTTPEPSSILLFGSGILGLAGVLRRKLAR